MMSLPENFTFTQGKIQDYLNCQKLFYLKFALNLSWQAVIAEPPEDYELLTQSGQRFHQMIRQYFTGIPGERICQNTRSDMLGIWWKNFLRLRSEPGELEFIWRNQTQNHPELVIITTLANFKIVGKYDLISITQGHRLVIVDWKTSERKPSSIWLNKRMQTKLYPYLLVEAGNYINQGKNIDPDMVEMIYWYSNYPEQPQRFSYDREQHLANGQFFSILIDEINHKQDSDFIMTTGQEYCGFCKYRSLCKRGSRANKIEDFIVLEESTEEYIDREFSLEYIPDIAF